MTRHDQHPFTTGRRLAHEMRALGHVQAPSSLLATVLTRVGLGDAYASLATPIGPVYVAYNERGISAVMQAADAAQFESAFQARFNRPARPLPVLPTPIAENVQQLFAGATLKTPQLDLRGLSEFERAVLLKALEIPRGEVRPYAWIAREIGRPGAVRAVGTALGGNPVPLLIPCHRVVRSDGMIGNYVFGGEAKRAALAAEGAAPEILEQLAHAGVRYYADDTREQTFCYPSCGHMHLRHDSRRRTFHSAQQALREGYRPCRDCRPAVAGV